MCVKLTKKTYQRRSGSSHNLPQRHTPGGRRDKRDQHLRRSIQEGPGKKQPRADDEVVKSFLVWQQLVEFHEIIRQRKDES